MMAKYAFIVPPLTGHINPTLSLGSELLDRNHSVSWICLDPELNKQLPKGGELLIPPIEASNEEKSKLIAYAKELQKKKVYGIDSLKFLYEEVLTPMNSLMIQGIEKILQKYKPDVIIHDHQIYAGSVAALKYNIPYATSVTAPASIKVNANFPKIYEWEGEQIIKFQNNNGILKNERLDCSSLLTLVYTSKIFFGENNLPSNFKFIGPAIATRHLNIEFDWKKFEIIGNNRPKILVSIGTNFDYKQKIEFFNKIIEAFEDQEVAVVLISDPNLFKKIPKNFIIQNKIPQLEIIPHIQLVICHGGNNTVCEALSEGIPLVVIPIAYDQSFISTCVVENGVGIRLNFNRFKVEHLKNAVTTILNENSFKENAHFIQKSFKEAGGIKKGADYLEQLLN
ncbi:glycosyl transferase [Apibacter muscae]|uniref:Glycosyl transferase n=2 Tax=Apibacter muscae TaxID=2509004 RepID=A0A563DI27_9FLAO|nr:glycosyl transferase [Apibacter muscae]TWP30958.1 glycosyl transferase [Apibacter muscae]